MQKDKDICVLDLHGIVHEEVDSKCHKFVNSYWASRKEGQIITGNSLEMKTLVTNVLKQYDIDFELGPLNNSGFIRLWFE